MITLDLACEKRGVRPECGAEDEYDARISAFTKGFPNSIRILRHLECHMFQFPLNSLDSSRMWSRVMQSPLRVALPV